MQSGLFLPVDDDPTSTTPKDIGTITLKIKRVIRTVTRPANTPLSIPTYRRTIDAASQHRVGFGPERSTTEQYPQTWGCKPYDAKHPESYVKFIFRYRSRGVHSSIIDLFSSTHSHLKTFWYHRESCLTGWHPFQWQEAWRQRSGIAWILRWNKPSLLQSLYSPNAPFLTRRKILAQKYGGLRTTQGSHTSRSTMIVIQKE